MEITDCVVSDSYEYVEIAVRLAQDEGYRGAVEDKIREASQRLFEDVDAAREHERFFEQMVAEARSRAKTQ
jgi:predicted O-linked N-acetylglucosamine transferase (SPINDLY family)